MPPLVLSASDSEYTNNVSLSDAPAVWLTGDRIRFINSESGRAITTTADVAAIRMDGADGVVINQAGGVIRSAIAGGTPLVIQGSAGSDRVENSGTIIGLVALGEGSDTFVSRGGTSEFQTVVDLGGGDDFYYLRPTSSISLSPRVDGGAGLDRYVIFESDGNVDGPLACNFEILDLRSNGFIESFSGLETIVADFRVAGHTFNALRFFNTPDAEVQILSAGNNTSLAIYDRSSIGSVAGSEFGDSVDLGNDTLVSGRIDLGGGDDFLTIRRSQFENPQQVSIGEEIDGGTGTDTLTVNLYGGDVFDAFNVVNFERMRVSTSVSSASALVIRNVDHVPELVIGQFNAGPVRLESSDLSAGSVMIEPTGSLIITADSVVGFVFSLTPFPIDTVISDDTRSISIVNAGQILGEVRLYIGDDLLDSRGGTVGGHVFGYAGNDTLLTGSGDDWLDGGAGADTLSGGAGNDVLIGGSAGDMLIGGTGDDAMAGGIGNDIYYVDSALDSVTEAANGGRDVVYASVSYALGAGQEVEVLSTVSQVAGTAINLTGNGIFNEIYGNDGDNVIDGGGGSDYLRGYAGNDIYFIDHGSDLVVETAGGGRDVIYTSVNFTLGAGSEIEVLSASSGVLTDPLELTGNALFNELYGNAGANILDGGGGADYLRGYGGNDLYFVNHGSDLVIEGAGEGSRDVIYARTSYTLGAGVGVEVLSVFSQSGGTAIDLTGNELANELYGNTQANYLDGGGGADYLQGFGGNDSYVVDTQGDVVAEGAGEGSHDVVFARASYALGAGVEVEVLSTISGSATTAIDLTGNELANELYGNNGANTLNGGAGNDYLQGYGGDDILYGGLGNDTLIGDLGADRFVFNTALGTGNIDFFVDFTSGTDKILLDHNIFTGLALGALDPAAFSGSGNNDGDDRIIFNPGLGFIYFDADGAGPGNGIAFALMQPGGTVTASDFLVI